MSNVNKFLFKKTDPNTDITTINLKEIIIIKDSFKEYFTYLEVLHNIRIAELHIFVCVKGDKIIEYN